MSTGSTLNQDQVERKVTSLAASEFSATQLRRACFATLDAQLPLRDAIVLREAKRLTDAETARSREAWAWCKAALQASVPPTTYAIWMEPIEVVGEDIDALLIHAPIDKLGWLDRRYRGLLNEVARAVTDFQKVRFVAAGGEG